MKFERLKEYRCRDGQRIVILEFYGKSMLCAREDCVGGWYIAPWELNGAWKIGQQDPKDIVSVVSEWDEFIIDEPVMVKNRDNEPWLRRYFAGVDFEHGHPTAWMNGKTSWTAESRSPWIQCRKPTQEELESK